MQSHCNQFSSRWSPCAWKSPFAFHPDFQKFLNIVFESVIIVLVLLVSLLKLIPEVHDGVEAGCLVVLV